MRSPILPAAVRALSDRVVATDGWLWVIAGISVLQLVMNSIIRSHLFLSATLVAAILPATLTAQPFYVKKDLGTLGGAYSSGRAINASGEVTGYSHVAGDAATHAFLYSHGRMIDLGTLGGTFSAGYGINSCGEVAGDSTIVAGSATSHAFLYSRRRMIDLGTLGGTSSYGLGNNDAGEVVGYSHVAGDTATHAFLFSRGRMVDLDTLGGTSSYATSINAWGDIAGYSLIPGDTATHAFLYSDGTMIDLGALGGTSSYATAINVWGEVTGYFNIAGDSAVHAFLYSDGVMTDLTPSGFHHAPAGINRWSQVVGARWARGENVQNPFFFSAAMHGLRDLLGDDAGDLMYVAGINDAGQIVATGRYDGAALLTPLPEPGAWAAGRSWCHFRPRQR
jgi:probable HAF family extracellular repeat protein